MFCPSCGARNDDVSQECSECGGRLPRLPSNVPQRSALDEPGIGLLIPVRPEPVSLIAGYIGIFGFVLCGIPGPVAIGLGIFGLHRLKSEPELRGKARAITAIVLGSLQTVLMIALIVSAMLSP